MGGRIEERDLACNRTVSRHPFRVPVTSLRASPVKCVLAQGCRLRLASAEALGYQTRSLLISAARVSRENDEP